ncbi:Kelch repeat-containing [Hyphodiscus hymeniophilus]|uniref:Kelch repeat-containing n=1 Tax=Hyphodiscus hymeniophilus TaxID=353542 RepID=A0A9P7AXT1_9HELO|nr:Kelch repeat-containing [Hyphodiscus hymeniophilus]
MSFTHDTHSTRVQTDRGRLSRPSFSTRDTSDRLRESSRASSSSVPGSKPKPQRKSVFREEGLDDLNSSRAPHIDHEFTRIEEKPGARTEGKAPAKVTFDHILKDAEYKDREEVEGKKGIFGKFRGERPKIKTATTAPPGLFPTIPRAALIVLLICVVVPGFRYSAGGENVIGGADAGVIRTPELVENGSVIEGRQNSPTTVCTRWSHQAANVNGTLYIFGEFERRELVGDLTDLENTGGQATTEAGQDDNTWNNDFMTLDLTKTWDIASPVLSGLPQPSGPPAVAEGYLWHSWDTLWLYGGEFSDSPATSPLPVSTWEYDIGSSTWSENANPRTTAGNASDGGGSAVQRAAEGAGLSVPELGLSWYFGGHLDLFTTEGWSNQIARVYLKSLLEFTHPGYGNTGVPSLGSTVAAPNEGVYRNITEGGLQDSAGFTERADGVLVYVPGWGDSGIILGLAGGTNETFTEMNVIDVYDIANSTWYKQSTSGTSPPIRVDPCAVVAAAPDGSSFQVHLYGGQNLIPYGSQIQYSDMWILTIPSFTWIQVDMDGQSQPAARAGHTCNIWDGQMIVVGGYVGKDISCDSPGIYNFNLSSLQWTNSFTSLSSSSSSSSGSSESGAGSSASIGYSGRSGSLQGSMGSYGYEVPAVVQSIIGGSSQGGATASTPASGPATAGPIATGKPPTFTITQSGSTVVQTAHSTSTVVGATPTNTSSPRRSGANVGVIAASVIAGVLAALAAYLAFCTWLYRRQLRLYKNHVAMAQRTSFNGSPDNWNSSGEASGVVGGRVAEKFPGPGAMLGPFGTEIGGSGSAGRPSLGASSAGTGRGSPTPGLTPQESSGQNSHLSQGSGIYSAGITPERGGYGRMSEGDESTEYMGANQPGPNMWGSTAHSSVEDLLGGQEPSFFSVVLNPRRTLRVVNMD